ncbi:MAG: hypothetical protein ACJ75R_05465 [Solirubrobacterales bacterium]
MEVVIAILILACLALFVVAPLRRSGVVEELREEALDDPVIADLEARKEAKYREIRDAELDHAQGKLSDADWTRADAQLRREAIEILKQIDEARAK